MPSMERLWQRFRGRAFEVVAVSLDSGSVEPVRKFVKEGKFTFVVLHDADSKTEVPFGVRGLPISYVIDHEGRMVAGAIGEQNWGSKKAFEYFDQLVKKVPAN
jgi:peroxiredoxin